MSTQRDAHNGIRRALESLPKGLSAEHSIKPPNRPITIYSGIFELVQGRTHVKVRGSIKQHWYPRPIVRFKGRPTADHEIDFGTASIRVRKLGFSTRVNVTERSLGSWPRIAGSISGIMRFGRNRAVKALRFYVPNFHDYCGRLVHFPVGNRIWRSASRLQMSADQWLIQIDQDPQYKQLTEALEAKGGYGVGHVGQISRVDGASFKVDQVSDLWSALHFYLSFGRGLWCGPIVATGVGSTRGLWTEWGSWRISDWSSVPSWFPKLDPWEFEKSFSAFHRLWCTKTWKQPLSELVHWYVEANLNAGALEGALILSHTALELLAWMHLVVSTRTYSIRSFKKPRSSDRICLALASLGIPDSIPPGLADLTAVSEVAKAKTGPEIIAKMRNWLVHPTPANRRAFDTAPNIAVYQAFQLSQCYLELGILALLRYSGDYVDRVRTGVFVGEATRRVPWAPQV